MNWNSHEQQSAARREAAHSAIDKVFQNIKQKIRLLEEKRRRQGELFLKVRAQQRQRAANEAPSCRLQIQQERILVLKERKKTDDLQKDVEESQKWSDIAALGGSADGHVTDISLQVA